MLCVCTCACVYVCVHTHVCVRAHVRPRVCVCFFACVCACVWVCVGIFGVHICVCAGALLRVGASIEPGLPACSPFPPCVPTHPQGPALAGAWPGPCPSSRRSAWRSPRPPPWPRWTPSLRRASPAKGRLTGRQGMGHCARRIPCTVALRGVVWWCGMVLQPIWLVQQHPPSDVIFFLDTMLVP